MWVSTGTAEEAECEGPATLILYGDKGHSLPVPIGATDGFTFTSGNTDMFDGVVNLPEDVEELGELYKVRIGFEEDHKPGKWFLDQVKITIICNT